MDGACCTIVVVVPFRRLRVCHRGDNAVPMDGEENTEAFSGIKKKEEKDLRNKLFVFWTLGVRWGFSWVFSWVGAGGNGGGLGV